MCYFLHFHLQLVPYLLAFAPLKDDWYSILTQMHNVRKYVTHDCSGFEPSYQPRMLYCAFNHVLQASYPIDLLLSHSKILNFAPSRLFSPLW
jgi:hypothetical protein